MRALCSLGLTKSYQVWVLLLACACHPPQSTSRRPLRYYEPNGGQAQASTTQPELDGLAAPSQGSSPNAGDTKGVAAGGKCEFAPGQLFSPTAPWNQRVDATPVAAESSAVIGFLSAQHTSAQRFRTDFSFVVQQATADTPRHAFVPTEDHYSPDCDIMRVPLVRGGRIEGESGTACSHDGDCHLLVHVPQTCQLYEMWRANITPKGFSGGCLAVWDTRMNFGNDGRGVDCTSADASGLPITPLLFSAADLTKGSINHALRLILPNKLIRKHIYVPPATHSTGPTSGPREAPPYGARFRLKANVDIGNLGKGAQVVATALQRYGMIIVDGGEVSFTATSDQETTAKWGDTGFSARALESLKWSDFEMLLPPGPPRLWQSTCARTQLTE